MADYREIPEDLKNAIGRVLHPAINFSLERLGIIREYHLEGNKVSVTFAFPFPNIPIKDMLIGSVKGPVEKLGYSMDYKIDLMTDQERSTFMQLEQEGWQGM